MQQPDSDGDSIPKTKLEPERNGGSSGTGSGDGPPKRRTAIGFGGDDPFDGFDLSRDPRFARLLPSELGKIAPEFVDRAFCSGDTDLTIHGYEELRSLLHQIGEQPGVIGSMLLRTDGSIIAQDLPDFPEKDSFAALSLCIYGNSSLIIKMLKQKRLHQIVCETRLGCIAIADCGGGLLVVLSEHGSSGIVPLMRGFH